MAIVHGTSTYVSVAIWPTLVMAVVRVCMYKLMHESQLIRVWMPIDALIFGTLFASAVDLRMDRN